VRRAALVNDVLIALTARSIGATLYTADRGDFEAIRRVRDFALEVVSVRRPRTRIP
jgi:predicted nucleic acid-binding protein